MVGLALLALCLLIAGCTRPPNREFLLDGSTDCEARDCGCGTIEVSTASGDAIEIAGSDKGETRP